MLHQGRVVLNLSGAEKQALKVTDLLALFHNYEDQALLSGGVYDN
jgi:putative ABC transport system ATP-binding protein